MILAMLLTLTAAPDPEVNCANPQYQVEMNFCAQQEYERADAALNVQWKKTSAAMKKRDRDPYQSDDNRPGYMATLLEAQRAWIASRDAHCERARKSVAEGKGVSVRVDPGGRRNTKKKKKKK